MPKITVSCPSCRKQYNVEIEEGMTYEDMECPNCSERIPIPPLNRARSAPTSNPENEAEKLQCPICRHVFVPPFDLETHVGGVDCPKCHSRLPMPLEKNIINPRPERVAKEDEPSSPSGENNGGVYACSVFCFLSVLNFVAGEIAAIADAPLAVPNALYWGGIAFILLAIYFKLPKPSK